MPFLISCKHNLENLESISKNKTIAENGRSDVCFIIDREIYATIFWENFNL